MKRIVLIAGGTVGGLGAVLAITPPQLTSTTTTGSLSGSLGGNTSGGQVSQSPTAHASTPTSTPASTSASPTPTKKAPSSKPTNSSSQGATSTPSATATSTPTPAATKTTAAPATTGYSGTITGGSFAARNYGVLSATVTFKDGKITNVSAFQSPSSWSQNSLTSLIPYVNSGKITVEQIKQYTAEQLPCAISNSCNSRASFTATAFWSSIKSAIEKARL
jgi:uncharacterized protein with FMN-binding domain